MQAAIAHITPHLTGREIEDFDTLLASVHGTMVKNTTAKSALEIALYDLKAQAASLPLYKLLGGTQTRFKTDITISMNGIDEMIADAQKAVALGYDTLKIKIGSDPGQDADRIIGISRALGPDITLRLDANQGWSAQESIDLLLRLEKRGIVAEFIEQPVAADDIEGLKYIKERVETPVLADESVFSLRDAQKLLEMEAIDFVNIKLAKTGGISHALKLADLCQSYGVKCMIGCMLEGPISVAAGVHVASAKADTITMLDLDAVSLLASHPAKSDIIFNESEIVLLETPGLGISL
jgi:o-succinylbenzoate synthase